MNNVDAVAGQPKTGIRDLPRNVWAVSLTILHSDHARLEAAGTPGGARQTAAPARFRSAII